MNRGALPSGLPSNWLDTVVDSSESGSANSRSSSSSSDSTAPPSNLEPDLATQAGSGTPGPPSSLGPGGPGLTNLAGGSLSSESSPSFNLKLDQYEFVQRPVMHGRACTTNGGGGEACFFRDALLCTGFTDVHKVGIVVPKGDPLWGELGPSGLPRRRATATGARAPAAAASETSPGQGTPPAPGGADDGSRHRDSSHGHSTTSGSNGGHDRDSDADIASTGPLAGPQAVTVDWRFNEQASMFPRGFRIGLNKSLSLPQAERPAPRVMGTDPRKRWPDAVSLHACGHLHW